MPQKMIVERLRVSRVENLSQDWKDERRALEEGVRGMGGVSWLGFYRGEVVDPSYYVGAEALNVAVPAERKNELKALVGTMTLGHLDPKDSSDISHLDRASNCGRSYFSICRRTKGVRVFDSDKLFKMAAREKRS